MAASYTTTQDTTLRAAIATDILLEEVGLPYETEKVDVGAGRRDARAAIPGGLPKGKVPTPVRDDGSVPTEYAANATWLACTDRKSGMLHRTPRSKHVRPR